MGVALLYYRSDKKSRHENLDEIIVHSWKCSPYSSLLWTMRLSCIIDLKKLSTRMFGRNHRPLTSNFSCREFLWSLIQESHNNYRIEPSGDHFLQLALISSKFSTREFLGMYNTREPHQSQKWAIWRQFSWVGDDFVESFMSRVSRDLYYKRATTITELSYLETIFLSWRWLSSKFATREFLGMYNTREPHQSQKWAIWRQFPWVGDDFVQTF